MRFINVKFVVLLSVCAIVAMVWTFKKGHSPETQAETGKGETAQSRDGSTFHKQTGNVAYRGMTNCQKT